MKKLFILLTSLLTAGSMMAEPVTLTFKDYPKADSDLGTTFTTTTLLDSLQNSAGFVTCTNVANTYAARIGMGSKLGTSSKTGTFTLSLVTPAEFDSIVVNAASYSATEGSLSINGGEAIDLTDGGTSNKALRNIAYIPTGSVETFTLATTAKRAYVKSITFYPKSSSPVTTTYNVNLTINNSVEGDVVLAGADTAQSVIEPAIIFQEGDNKVPAGNYIFVTAFSDIDYTREAVITVNGDTVDTYFGGWVSETTIDADMNIVVAFPKAVTPDTISMHIVNPVWEDYVAEEGWWQVSGVTEDKMMGICLCSTEDVEEIAGTYTKQNIDLQYCALFNFAAENEEDQELAIKDVTATIEEIEGNYIIKATVLASDGNVYIVTFDPISNDPNANNPYDMQEDVAHTYTMANIEALSYRTISGIKVVTIQAMDESSTFATMMILDNDTTVTPGTYAFAETIEPFTATPGSLDLSQGTVYPTYFGNLKNGSISIPLFLCTGGNIVVTNVGDSLKLEVNATNTWNKTASITLYIPAPKKPVPTNVKLTDADFHAWTSALPGAEIDDTKKFFESHFGEEKTDGATLYGCGNVLGTQYADLTGYDSITFFGKGTFRVLYNATADVDPKGHVEKLFTTNEDGYVTFAINDLEYFHLNVIKAPWGEAVQRLDSIILNYKPAPKLPEFTVDVTIANADLNDYTSQGIFQMMGYSADSTQMAALTIFSNKIEGTYDMATAMGSMAGGQYNFVVVNADSETDYSYLPIQSGTLTVTKVSNDTCEYYQAIGTLVSDTTCINLTLTTAAKKTTTGGGDGDTIAIHLVDPQLGDYTSQMGLWQIIGSSEDERYEVGVCGLTESEIAGNYTMDNIEASYYTYIYDNDTDTEYAPADFNGKVELKEGAYVLSAIFTAEDGTVFVLTSDPIDPNAGNQYDSKEAMEYTFAHADAEEWELDEYQGVSYAFLAASNEEATITISVNFMGDTIPAGTYTFASTYEAGTADAGQIDMSEGDIYPSFFSHIDEDGYLEVPLYLCTGGSAVVSYVGDSIKVEVNATNTWGAEGHFIFFVDAHKGSGDKPQLEKVNTIANVIACADAKVLNDNDSVKVTGYISGMFLKPTNFMKYGSVSIWLTDTLGGSAKEFELYNCYGMMGDTLATWGPNFVETGTQNIDVESVTGRHGIEFKLGDKIVATGKFKFYNGTYELNTGCYIVEGGAATGITTLAAEKAAKDGKFLEKNDIVIVKNGKRYNVLGTPIK